VQFKLAILTVLATRPNGRATLDGLRYEVEALTADADQADVSALDDIDIFKSGLVTTEGDWLRITEAGRAALQAIAGQIEGQSEAARDHPPQAASHSMRMIDDLIGTEGRQKIFDLELRGHDADRDRAGPDAGDVATTRASLTAPDAETDPPESIAHGDPQPAEPMHADAPTFLVRDGLRHHAPGREVRSRLSSLIAARLTQARAIWRRHLEQDANLKAGSRRAGNVSGAAIALLSLLVLVICAGAVVALTQIRSLKSKVATLQRELSPLRERAARADLLEKAKQNADQQKEAQIRSDVERNKAGAESRTEQAALNLTQDEIRLIREFIKPAPVAGTPAPAINVGDAVGGGTIPLPSPLMEKIPKLLGARFTTRNGSIIIVRRDSRQADAVLPPS
jgi:hypothetical protein